MLLYLNIHEFVTLLSRHTIRKGGSFRNAVKNNKLCAATLLQWTLHNQVSVLLL